MMSFLCKRRFHESILIYTVLQIFFDCFVIGKFADLDSGKAWKIINSVGLRLNSVFYIGNRYVLLTKLIFFFF